MNIKKSKFILSSFIVLTSAFLTNNNSLADDSGYEEKVSEVYEKYSENKEKSDANIDRIDNEIEEKDSNVNNRIDESIENSLIQNENNSKNLTNNTKESEKNEENNNSKLGSIENSSLEDNENKEDKSIGNKYPNENIEPYPELKNTSVNSSSYSNDVHFRSARYKSKYINSYNTKEEFLKMINSHSDLARQYNIFPEVMMGQAILESNWGQSKLSKKSRNIFGVKVPRNERGKGKGDFYDTKEFINGKYVTVKAEFRRFNTYEESIRQYLSLLNGNYYSKFGVNKAKNYKEQLQRIKNAGYATAPNYVSSVLNVIEKNISPKNTWIYKNNDKYYSDSNGNFLKGIYSIGINKYYFANDGKLKTNTKVVTNKGAYTIGSDGIMSPIRNRWIKVNTNHYHTDNEGLLNKGLFLIDNNHYSFDLTFGRLEKNKIYKSNNHLFASDNSGVINRRKNTSTVLGNYEYTTDYNGKITKVIDLTKRPSITLVTSYISNGIAYNKLSDNSVRVAKNSWVEVAGKDFRTDSNGRVLYGIRKIGNYYYHLTYNGISKGYKVFVNKHLYSFDNTGKGYLVSSNYTPKRDLDIAMGWMFQAMNFNYEYSMHWQKRNQVGYADCSSAVYRAMKHGGFISNNVANGNTETLFELGRRGQILKQISENEIRYGDIFVAGVPGRSAGAGGHTGFILDKNTIIHCNYADNGVSITQRKGRMGDKKYPVRYYRLVGAR
ncbi:MAG: peptidoglycan amidohydrolase family protein [Anaerococcus vaginalis]|nr:peptidoglycan amidohydrolase family protein [Anaerococcus vaginalis]